MIIEDISTRKRDEIAKEFQWANFLYQKHPRNMVLIQGDIISSNRLSYMGNEAPQYVKLI